MVTIGDCGVMLEPQLGMSMEKLVETAKVAENLGFGYLFRSDHLLPTDGRRGIDSPECWTSLGAIAASTSSLKFGPMVTPISFRNPSLLAKMACTLHSFSRGRLQLAVGAGWYEAEYKAYGYLFPNITERLAQFREAYTILSQLIRDGRSDYEGKYFSAHTDCLPRPHGEVHFIVGGKSKSLVRLAAKKADEWNIFLSPKKEFESLRDVLSAASDSRRVEVSETGPFILDRNQSELEANAALQASKLAQSISPVEILKRIRDRNAPCGTVDDFAQQLGAKVDSGIQKFYFQALVPENISMLELLADVLKTGV